jgi:two-component system, sensor histidine kinase and response regulator
MRVLLVDDQAIVAEAVRRFLASVPGVAFHYCADPKAAVTIATQLRPTVILQDLIMPGVDGLDLLKQYRANPATKDTPVIVLSTKEDAKTKAQAFELGANDYLVKLPDRVELIARIRFQSQFFLNQIQRDEAYVALNSLNLKLEEADAAKNRFLGMAAHDLRNPLATVRGFAEFLRDGTVGALTADQLDLVATIHTCSCAMLKLVNELLDVAVIEAGEFKLEPKPHDLTALIEKSVYLTGIEAAKKQTKIIFAPPAGLQPVRLDADKMKQVIDNLLSNAVKYSPPGSTITVELHDHEGQCGFSVSDEGPGIPENERGKLFKDFGRLSTVPTGGESSTGLGLAICRKIVEAHQGAIVAENLPDRGCAFRVTLPPRHASSTPLVFTVEPKQPLAASA